MLMAFIFENLSDLDALTALDFSLLCLFSLPLFVLSLCFMCESLVSLLSLFL